ncbi:50S ribosomal protein L31 [bacterium]|nr:50S ribosomal protein L31 [bacterium]
MKKDIHPKYNKNVKVTCTCGFNFKVGSTIDKLDLEICSQCHPFYTGKQKLIDDSGVIDKYKKRISDQAEIAKDKIGKKAKKARQISNKKEKSEK